MVGGGAVALGADQEPRRNWSYSMACCCCCLCCTPAGWRRIHADACNTAACLSACLPVNDLCLYAVHAAASTRSACTMSRVARQATARRRSMRSFAA